VGPIELGPSLLAELEARLAVRAPALLERLEPGIAEDEMERLVAPLEITLPAELRRWWGWRNGVSRAAIKSERERWLGYQEVLVPLAEAVEIRTSWFEFRIKATGYPPDWEPTWLPIGQGVSDIVCDCSDERIAPVLLLDPMDEDARKPRTRSLGDLVSWWIEAMDIGAWTYVGGREGWEVDWERLSPEMRRSALV
jgi:cell wall assembly regulator SMI1